MKKQDVYVAWITWSIIFLIAIRNFSVPFITQKAEPLQWSDQVLYAIIVFSLLETGITFLLRHFAIMKPFKNGRYNPNTQVARFFIIGILNWIISNSIVFYGTMTYCIYGTIWQHYFFGILGFALLVFHAPRLGPFKKVGV